jgi:hypothetical protein
VAMSVFRRHEFRILVLPDTTLGCVHTDSQGNFNVSGSTNDITSLDPMLKIYTNCNDKTLYGLVSKVLQKKKFIATIISKILLQRAKNLQILGITLTNYSIS